MTSFIDHYLTTQLAITLPWKVEHALGNLPKRNVSLRWQQGLDKGSGVHSGTKKDPMAVFSIQLDIRVSGSTRKGVQRCLAVHSENAFVQVS